MKKFVLISILGIFAFLVPSSEMAFAEGGIAWRSAGELVCTVSGNQQNLRMVPDGSGGAIIVWEDQRYGSSNTDIYAQRINKDGNQLWGVNGVAVSTAPNSQIYPVVVGDGYGGAIIAWEDYRGGTISAIYAVRISSTGATHSLWPTNGTQLSTSPYRQCLPEIVSDGQYGAIVVWKEWDSINYWIYGQRIDGNGMLQWPTVPEISSGMEPKEIPKIINDGTGYVIVTWQDSRSGNFDIYAQKMWIPNGALSWAVNGTTVTAALGDQINPQIVPDGTGGAIVTWTDYRNTLTYSDIYAQRISSVGVQQWDIGGVDFEGIPVSKIRGEQHNANIVESFLVGQVDGAIIAWEDRRDDSAGDIYAVKVDLDESNSDLTLGGKLIATGSQCQRCPRVVSDNQGGGIGTWIEKSLSTNQWQIFATKRDQYGEPVWNIYPGVLVCQGSGIRNQQIVKDDAGGIIVAWEAIGPYGDYDIFAQRVVDNAIVKSASICGRVVRWSTEQGITGVEVWALNKDGQLVSSCTTSTAGDYGLTGLVAFSTYTVRALWTVNGIESSVSMDAVAPSYRFDFTLEIDYLLGTIAGNVSGVEREAKRVSGSGLYQSFSRGNGIAFVELEQRGKVIVRVPLEMDGNYSIPNLLPGRFIARAYNGSIYSNSRIVDLSGGETLRVDFAFGVIPEETVFNYPNPAKGGSTTIRYYCGYTDPEAEIKIYNIAGELVKEIEDNEIDKSDAAISIYRYLWDCKNSSGKEVASGIYTYVVEVKEKGGNESKKVVKRMAVIR